jgi:hypothetical protein
MSNYGWNLFPYFFGDMREMTWAGQFNLDFTGFLIVSALWTSWRNNFSVQGLLLGALAFFGGMLFLTIYLLYLSFETRGNVDAMILGNRNSGGGDA